MQNPTIHVEMEHAVEATVRRALSEHIDALADRGGGSESGIARAMVFDRVLDGIGSEYGPYEFSEDDVRDMITAVRARIEVADAEYRAALDSALMVLLRALA